MVLSPTEYNHSCVQTSWNNQVGSYSQHPKHHGPRFSWFVSPTTYPNASMFACFETSTYGVGICLFHLLYGVDDPSLIQNTLISIIWLSLCWSFNVKKLTKYSIWSLSLRHIHPTSHLEVEHAQTKISSKDGTATIMKTYPPNVSGKISQKAMTSSIEVCYAECCPYSLGPCSLCSACSFMCWKPHSHTCCGPWETPKWLRYGTSVSLGPPCPKTLFNPLHRSQKFLDRNPDLDISKLHSIALHECILCLGWKLDQTRPWSSSSWTETRRGALQGAAETRLDTWSFYKKLLTVTSFLLPMHG